jgi:3-oxoacyl-[acyl-carrier-protein] synthase III
MPIHFESVFVNATGSFMPGEPIDNDSLDRYIAPLSAASGRIKRRILAENGIKARHYAIDQNGLTLHSATAMAAAAVRDCLDASEVQLKDLTMLCTGSSGGDIAVPGFANMLQGELHAPPLLTSSHQGVCAAGVSALLHAASALELSDSGSAMVATSEIPSRMFKRSRYAPRDYDVDFDSHFLRWMLSDGAGAWLLGKQARSHGLSLQLRWIHARSFSGDLPVCMQIGSAEKGRYPSYLDYESLQEAEADGAFLLRQDIRLLPHLFELGIHEYVDLIRQGEFSPDNIDHFLCHYSSQKFAGVVEELMTRANLMIPKERWYSNLATRGNTGAASIFIMLADFIRERELKPGQKILCFVPESGRFTVSFLLLEVVAPTVIAENPVTRIAAPHDPAQANSLALRNLLSELASVWHDYRSRAWRTQLIQKISSGKFQPAHYRQWMECWIPQVREGSAWMRQAVLQLDERHAPLAELIASHAGDEQFDYQILFDDYRSAGGSATHLDTLKRNPGGEALHAYMQSLAGKSNPIGLLGAIYIIEGTGQRIIPALLPLLRRQLDLPEQAYRFLGYHGENDASHLERWLKGVEIALELNPSCHAEIVAVARTTAQLYLLQMEHAL